MTRDDASVSSAEVARFGALAPHWWDARGPMRALHAMNPLRTGWTTRRIRDVLGQDGIAVLDVGCGGGIATEALARAGFMASGIDASPEAIGVARSHAEAAGLRIDYRVGLADDMLAAAASFPAITAFEIIEHVPDQDAFIATLAGLLAPGGVLFVSTLNRTIRSLAVAKIGAEYVARLLPRGTHDWKRFVKPEELAAMGRRAGLRLADVSGMSFGASGRWAATGDTSVNYIAMLVRD